MSGTAAWIWVNAGVATAAAGLLLALWALFWDRARGRKRCPKCSYGMEGAPRALQEEKLHCRCPECGKVVGHDRLVLRTRRWWQLALAGVVAILLANNARFAYQRTREGWMRWVPTSLLIVSVRPTGSPEQSWAMDILRDRLNSL